MAALIAAFVLVFATPSTAHPVDPNFPSLEEEQVGVSRNLVDLARQPAGNGSDMGRAKRSSFDDLRYQDWRDPVGDKNIMPLSWA